jgi:hypothetical protein
LAGRNGRKKNKKGFRERATNIDSLPDKRRVDGLSKKRGHIMRIKIASQKGAALVEFAIVLPILLVLLFGIIDFSILLYNKASITNASREGARAGIVFRAYDSSNAPEPKNDNIGKKIPITSPIIQNIITQRVWDYLGQAGADSPANNLISFGDPKSVGLVIQPNTIGTDSVVTIRVTYGYDFLVVPRLLKLFFLSNMLDNMNLVSESTMRIE